MYVVAVIGNNISRSRSMKFLKEKYEVCHRKICTMVTEILLLGILNV
jgi:hypothetical protein